MKNSILTVLATAGLCATTFGQTQPAAMKLGLTRTRAEALLQLPHPILSRELLRQATLIAARRELGIAVADEVLGETARGPGIITISPDVTFVENVQSKAACSYSLWQDGKTAPLMTTNLDNAAWLEAPQDAMVIAEQLSRTTLVDTLKAAGLAGTPPAAEADGAVDPAALLALNKLELLSQLAAARLIDKQMAEHGESPERLAAMARGCANLWQLSEYLWGAEPKDFAARALLYGQRAVIKYPTSAIALDSRAYAEALVGLPKAALADFDAAKTARGKADAPPWKELAADLARYDVGALSDIASNDPRRAGMASFFAFLSVEHMPGNVAPINFAQLALKSSPDNVRLISAINDRSGPGLANWSSRAGFSIFSLSLFKVGTLPGVPAAVKEQAAAFFKARGSMEARKALTDALRTAGRDDTAEPSWQAMARTCEDANFVTAFQMTMHVAAALGQDPSDMTTALQPLFVDHRYAAVIAAVPSYHLDPTSFHRKMATMAFQDSTYAMMPLLQRLQSPTVNMHVFNQSADYTAFDVETFAAQLLEHGAPVMLSGRMPMMMQEFIGGPLARVAPDSPTMIAGKIYSDWKNAEPHVQEWLDATGEHPTITLALAHRYEHDGNPMQAAAMYEKYLAVSPDTAIYNDLAEMYRKAGDDKKWLATIDLCLKQDSPGLENARLAESVSQYLVEHDRLPEALHYATQAADTYAAWGLDAAAIVRERLGQFDEAEKLEKDKADNYNNHTAWLEFCLRTGHGDFKTALAQTQDAVKDGGPDRESQTDRIIVELFNGENAAAQKNGEAALEQFGDQWSGLIAWSAALDQHDADGAARILARTEHPPRVFTFADGNRRTDLERFVQQLAGAIRANDKQFEPLVPSMKSGIDDVPNVCFFTGRYFESIGDRDSALKWYHRAWKVPDMKGACTLAAMRLRAMGRDPYATASTTQPAGGKDK